MNHLDRFTAFYLVLLVVTRVWNTILGAGNVAFPYFISNLTNNIRLNHIQIRTLLYERSSSQNRISLVNHLDRFTAFYLVLLVVTRVWNTILGDGNVAFPYFISNLTNNIRLNHIQFRISFHERQSSLNRNSLLYNIGGVLLGFT